MTEPDIRVAIAADPKLLAAVRSLVRCYVGGLGYPEARTDEVVLAVDEACTNAIRHACCGNKERKLHLTLGTTRAWLEVELRDGGRPAPTDAIRRGKARKPAGPESLTPGGLGIGLMCDIFDEVQFNPGRTRGNRTVMRLKLPARK